jgi:hypothetical protein
VTRDGDLAARVAAVRGYLYRRAVGVAAIWAAAGLVACGVMAWLLADARGWRAGSPVPLLLDAGMVAWLGLGVWAFRRWVDRRLDEEGVAKTIERAAQLAPGEVRGPLELSRSVPKGVSAALAESAARGVAARLDAHADEWLSGDLGSVVRLWQRRGWGAVLGVTVSLVVLIALGPARAGQAWNGLASPLRILAGADLPPLVVAPGDVEVMRGADVEIRVAAEGRRAVEIRWQSVGDVARSERVPVEDGRAAYVLRGVGSVTEYAVRGDDGSSSDRFRIQPVDPLFVSDLRIELEFPVHTGLPAEEYRGAAPTLRVPYGTRFTFAGRASRPLASVALADTLGETASELDVDGATFGGRWTPTRSGRFDWRFRDRQGVAPDLVPEPLRVLLERDEPPFVAISAPAPDTTLPLDLRQRVAIEAGDDYGLAALEMVAYRVTAVGDERDPVVQRFEMGGTRLASAAPLLDFSSWGLLPGDEIRYMVRAMDNAPGGQWAETPEQVLRVPSAEVMRRGVEETLEGIADRVAELAESARTQAEANREEARGRDLGAAGPRTQGAVPGQGREGFEERANLERALEQQERLEAALDSLGSQLGSMQRRLEDAGQADAALRAEMRELRELLDEVGGDDLGATSERLEDAVERGDSRETARLLDELAAEQERLQERLESSLERFQRAAVEQDFRATRSEIEDLARRERALADAMREDGAAPRAEQQASLTERAEALQEQLERLEERLRELGEETVAEAVARAGSSAEEAGASMRDASREASRGQGSQAAQSADQATLQLERAAAQLADAEMDMAQELMERIRSALERTGDDALSLARRQADLRSRMRGAGSDVLMGLRAEEAALSQGVQNLAENLTDATDGQVPGAREILAQMGRTLESIERTVAALDRPRSLGGSPAADAERAVGDLNRLALIAFESAEQMGRSGEGEQQGQEQIREALEELAQQQGDLVNQAGQIMPMELGQQATAQQLQRLSEGQQSVSDQLGDLSSQPGSEGALGDLTEMAAEAAELAETLAQGRLEPETSERQERLFHRLLDAGRSLERDDVSEERESEVPGRFERGTVLPLEEGQLGARPYGFPDAAQLRDLGPGMRRLILEYFERLNRTPATPPGGAGR